MSKANEGIIISAMTSALLRDRARELRANATDAEELLWSKLRRRQIHGVAFYRQRPVGAYILDFAATSLKLGIELDGSQHYSSAGRVKDRERTMALNALGYSIIRFDNVQVLTETDAVVQAIAAKVWDARVTTKR